MSFSSETRVELARIVPEEACCAAAQLAGIFRAENIGCGWEPPGDELEVSVGHPAVARVVYLLMRRVAGPGSSSVSRSRHKPPKRGYHVRLSADGAEVLRRVGRAVGDLNGSGVPESTCCRRAYLRGAYLVRGSVSSPAKAYHLEVNLDRKEATDSIVACMSLVDVVAKVTVRKDGYSVYIKESDGIVRLLSLMGAHQAVLEYENVRIVKGMRNSVNRLVNCETANVDKTINASMRQIEAIELLLRSEDFEELPQSLRLLAEARLAHPYASLKELGEIVTPRVSKSGVSYRMKQLMTLAAEHEKRRMN